MKIIWWCWLTVGSWIMLVVILNKLLVDLSMFALKSEHVRFLQDFIVWPKCTVTETAQTEMSPDRNGPDRNGSDQNSPDRNGSDRIGQTEKSHTLLSTGVSFADTVKYMFIVYSHERFSQNPFYFIYSVFDIPLKTGITKMLSENRSLTAVIKISNRHFKSFRNGRKRWPCR